MPAMQSTGATTSLSKNCGNHPFTVVRGQVSAGDGAKDSSLFDTVVIGDAGDSTLTCKGTRVGENYRMSVSGNHLRLRVSQDTELQATLHISNASSPEISMGLGRVPDNVDG